MDTYNAKISACKQIAGYEVIWKLLIGSFFPLFESIQDPLGILTCVLGNKPLTEHGKLVVTNSEKQGWAVREGGIEDWTGQTSNRAGHGAFIKG